MNKLIASGALVGASLGLLGCATEQVALTGSCDAVMETGEAVHPTSYPLGRIAIHYHTGTNDQVNKHTEGLVEQDGNNYYIAVKDIPSRLDNEALNGAWHDNNTNAVIIVNTPSSEFGLTPDCIERDVMDQYGIQTTRINLPTATPS